MPLILDPTHLRNGFNEKGRKTNVTINEEGVKKETLVPSNCKRYTRYPQCHSVTIANILMHLEIQIEFSNQVSWRGLYVCTQRQPMPIQYQGFKGLPICMRVEP